MHKATILILTFIFLVFQVYFCQIIKIPMINFKKGNYCLQRYWKKNLLTSLWAITFTNFKISIYKPWVTCYVVLWCHHLNLKTWIIIPTHYHWFHGVVMKVHQIVSRPATKVPQRERYCEEWTFSKVAKRQDKPSRTKFGKSSGALFSFCIRLFCCSNRFSSYGFLLFVFAEEDRVGKQPDETKKKMRSLRLKFSS